MLKPVLICRPLSLNRIFQGGITYAAQTKATVHAGMDRKRSYHLQL